MDQLLSNQFFLNQMIRLTRPYLIFSEESCKKTFEKSTFFLAERICDVQKPWTNPDPGYGSETLHTEKKTKNKNFKKVFSPSSNTFELMISQRGLQWSYIINFLSNCTLKIRCPDFSPPFLPPFLPTKVKIH